MALAHAIAGATRPSQIITWLRDNETPEDLTDATITGKIRDLRTGATRDIDGVLSVTDGSSGVFTWDYGTADVTDAGRFHVQFTATFGSNPTPARTVAGAWEVKHALT